MGTTIPKPIAAKGGIAAMMAAGVILFWILPVVVAAWLAFQLLAEFRSDRVPILLYHRLLCKADADAGKVPDDEMIWVSYDTAFADQMNYLRKSGYTTLDMDDYVAIRSGATPMPAKPIIVTFDDGYVSNYSMAFPVLRANSQKAVIYVAPEPDAHSLELVEGLDGFVNDQQMLEMAEHGISIQSHTLTHCILHELDDEAMRHELVESRRRISAATGKPVDHIAVPRSGGGQRVRRAIIGAGYRTSCGNDKGTASGLSDLYALPRIVIERDMTIQDFAACLTPKHALMLRIIGMLKRVPERIGGGRFAYVVRSMLYGGAMKHLFATRSLKRFILVFALAYVVAAAAFSWYALCTWWNCGSVGGVACGEVLRK